MPRKRPANIQPYDVFAANCPSRLTLERVTSRWGALTLAALTDEPTRFGDLRRRIDGISDKMLSQTLKAFEVDGLVERDVESEMPPRVTYRLTGPGLMVRGGVDALIMSLYDALPEILEHRPADTA